MMKLEARKKTLFCLKEVSNDLQTEWKASKKERRSMSEKVTRVGDFLKQTFNLAVVK